MRQEERHLVRAIAVGQDDGLVEVGLCILELIHLPHHHGRALHVVEIRILRICFIKLINPCALEANGIQKKTHQIGVLHVLKLQQVVNHAVGVVGSPLVDDIQRRGVAETEHRGGCVIICRCRVPKGRLKRNILSVAIEIDVVGYTHTCVLVEQGTLRQHLATEGIYRSYVGIPLLPSA